MRPNVLEEQNKERGQQQIGSQEKGKRKLWKQRQADQRKLKKLRWNEERKLLKPLWCGQRIKILPN